MSKTCDCKDFIYNMKEINSCVSISTIHGFPLSDTYKSFVYCPWCGKELEETYVGDSDHEHNIKPV